MIINIGQVFTYDDPIIALEIPGLGIVRSNKKENDFPFVELNRKQLCKLRKAIDKELEHEEPANVYRLQGCKS